MATRNTAHIFACSMLFRLARGFTHMTMPWEWHAAQLPCCASEMNPSEENMPLPLSPALNGPSAEQCCDLNSNSLSAVSCMLLLRPEDMVISLDLLKLAAAVTWHSSWTTACYHQSSNITALGTAPTAQLPRLIVRKIELSNIVWQNTREQTTCRWADKTQLDW